MSHESERGRFVEALRVEGVPEPVSRRVMRWAATYERLQCIACSLRELTIQEQAKEHRIEARMRAELEPYGVRPVFQGDCRGATVKLEVPSGRYDDWGKVGLCVPVRQRWWWHETWEEREAQRRRREMPTPFREVV